MSNVLLLRSPTTDGPDKYETTFKAQGYRAISVPVLETVLVNGKELSEAISQGPNEGNLKGVIVTSARACEAWKGAILSLLDRSPGGAGESMSPSEIHQALIIWPKDWTDTPFYVVGEATATSLREMRDAVGGSTLAPKDIRGGVESGTSEKLAHFILQDLATSSEPRKLLYLTGDKNRDVLPNILRDGGVEVQFLQVYATQGSSSFPLDLEKAIDSAPSGKIYSLQRFKHHLEQSS